MQKQNATKCDFRIEDINVYIYTYFIAYIWVCTLPAFNVKRDTIAWRAIFAWITRTIRMPDVDPSVPCFRPRRARRSVWSLHQHVPHSGSPRRWIDTVWHFAKIAYRTQWDDAPPSRTHVFTQTVFLLLLLLLPRPHIIIIRASARNADGLSNSTHTHIHALPTPEWG